MATIKVHAGDFVTGNHSQYMFGSFLMAKDEMGWTGYKLAQYRPEQVEVLEAASEETVKKWGGTIGWGAVGALALGPVGLLAGLLLGGKKNEVSFVVVFTDGKRALATTDSKTFMKMRASKF